MIKTLTTVNPPYNFNDSNLQFETVTHCLPPGLFSSSFTDSGGPLRFSNNPTEQSYCKYLP